MTTFKKAAKRLSSKRKGEWSKANGLVDITCPQCGGIGSIRGHRVAADGKITPSLVCPKEGCGFHDMGILEGWEG